MSMSTNIADLPGPVPEDQPIHEDFEEEPQSRQQQQQQRPPQIQQPQSQTQVPIQKPVKKEALYEQPNRIKMDVKKVNKSSSKTTELGMFDLIRKEVSEENLLILVILYIASTSLIDEYVKKLLTLASFNTSSFAVTLLKCIILLLLFILAKHFLLPYIRV